jgi:hypothetical protein
MKFCGDNLKRLKQQEHTDSQQKREILKKMHSAPNGYRF